MVLVYKKERLFRDMKIMIKTLFIMMLLVVAPYNADACVGKTLVIGITDTTGGHVIAEMLSILVNERTGTTIDIKYFENVEEIYEAIKDKEVDISVENTERALRLLNMPPEDDIKKAYKSVKATYENEKGMIWLKPFGFTKIDGAMAPSYTATILRVDVLNNFPALPRLFNKLGSKINDAAYAKLIRSVESGEMPKSVVKAFLKSKKLI